MWYWGSGVHWWGWLFGALGMVVFWALVIWAIVALVGWTRTAGPPTARREEDPQQVLARRFAAGEIDVEEYRLRLDILRGADLVPPTGQGRLMGCRSAALLLRDGPGLVRLA
ncbi:MAG: SHOCT domain-containing protein [Actinomycetota bacterium]|nr:SHOCT domain-containing protein [Actinomycetota bacterium]